MTPLDEAPEQRWRRAIDRRNRPAKLKIDRLLRDFGYAELDRAAGDAIEARLAGVALAVAPSLRDAVAGELVTIYANDSALPAEGSQAAGAGAVDPVPAEDPAVAADVAQMLTYLKQQVFDARSEAERLRTELDRSNAAQRESEQEKDTVIAGQAAALEEQSRQIAELGAALDNTRRALAETRDEIRRAVGELQGLPEPVAPDDEPPPPPDVDEPDALELAEGERSERRAASSDSSSEWLPSDLAPGHGDAPPAGPDVDDLLYDADELYGPDDRDARPTSDGSPPPEIEARRPDEPATVLPPPPPAPPSPWAGEGDPQPSSAAERPTVGRVLRARGGRSRGRWEGSCSICGCQPLENRRKELQAAGWDLDDEAAACPQCRGVG